jgi:DNA-binding MarR family transcriptional regulator
LSRDSDRDRLYEEVIDQVRRSQTANQTFDHAVADLLGINQTDFRCIDIIQRRERITAGDLAREAGLTTGAVTAVIDRLEGAGYARRVADPTDRRRVLVEITPELLERTSKYYAPLAEAAYEAFKDYTDEQLEFVREFHRAGSELNERMAARLREDPDGRGT